MRPRPPARLFLFVAGLPKPQPRHRTVDGRVVSWRHDKMAAAWADQVEREARRVVRLAGERWDNRARVGIEMMFTLSAQLADSPHEPDWDNLAKLACDALQRGGVLHNDRQILRASVGKQFTRDAGKIGLAIVLDGDGQQSLAFAPDIARVATP
jgi:Holliday junction resolvase RusA-like endonuclease